MRGAIFESWVANELYTHQTHRATLYHYRESRDADIDILMQSGVKLIACEAKSGATLQSSFLDHLNAFGQRLETLNPCPELEPRLIYGGDQTQRYSGIDCLAWRAIHQVDWGN